MSFEIIARIFAAVCLIAFVTGIVYETGDQWRRGGKRFNRNYFGIDDIGGIIWNGGLLLACVVGFIQIVLVILVAAVLFVFGYFS